VIGVEGLAPYLLETGLHAFIGFKGDVSLRFTQSFDLKITNRFVLEPQLETDLYLADVPERLIGSGFSTIETGVQARYELSRAFAPTLAVVYESRLGKSARLARDAGEDVGGWSVRGGVRLRF
jgi:copper resistance protein B